MYPEKELSLGTINPLIFWDYWGILKSRLSEIIYIGPKIAAQKAKIARLQARAEKTGDDEIINETRLTKAKIDETHNIWINVKTRLDRYLPIWKKIGLNIQETEVAITPPGSTITATTTTTTSSGLGILPLAIPAWAAASLIAGGLAALAYVTTKGVSTIREYYIQQSILNRLERGVISAEQAKGLLTTSTFFTNIGAKLGTYGGLALLGISGAVIYSVMKR